MKNLAFIIFTALLISGCLVSKSPTKNMRISVGMTLDEFLEINDLNPALPTTRTDRNSDGSYDLLAWDLDLDNRSDVLVELDESIKEGKHGSIKGFHKIIIYDYVESEAWIAQVGKTSGKIISIKQSKIN